MSKRLVWISLAVLLLLLSLLIASHFIWKAKEAIAENWNSFSPGMTTKSEVLSLMGAPESVSTDIVLDDGDYGDISATRTVELRWQNGAKVYVAGFDKNDVLVMKIPNVDWTYRPDTLVEPSPFDWLLRRFW